MHKSDLGDQPAFPVTTGSDGGCLNPGMTLRQHYVGQILASGIIDTEAVPETAGEAAAELGIPAGEYVPKTHWPRLRAKRALTYANAVIRALETPP